MGNTLRLLALTRTPEPACATPSSAKPEHADLIDRDYIRTTIVKRDRCETRVARTTAISASRH